MRVRFLASQPSPLAADLIIDRRRPGSLVPVSGSPSGGLVPQARQGPGPQAPTVPRSSQGSKLGISLYLKHVSHRIILMPARISQTAPSVQRWIATKPPDEQIRAGTTRTTSSFVAAPNKETRVVDKLPWPRQWPRKVVCFDAGRTLGQTVVSQRHPSNLTCSRVVMIEDSSENTRCLDTDILYVLYCT